MKQQKFTTWVIVGLILLNTLTLAYLFFGKKHPINRESLVSKRLDFDKSQKEQYHRLVLAHQKAIGEKEEGTIQLRQQLYTLLATSPLDTIKADSIFHCLKSHQDSIERVHFAHFQAIGNLCNNKQRTDYQRFIKEAAKIFAPRKIKQSKH